MTGGAPGASPNGARECFGEDRAALLLTDHLHPADRWLSAELVESAAGAGLPLVAANAPVHATRADKPLLDVLTAIRHRTTLDRAAAHGLLLPNSEHRLLGEATLRRRLAAHPEAFDCASRIAAQCSLDLDLTEVRFPGLPFRPRWRDPVLGPLRSVPGGGAAPLPPAHPRGGPEAADRARRHPADQSR